MQVSITFPDTEFPNITYLITSTSVVGDAVVAASEEWGIDVNGIEIYFCGKLLLESTTLTSHGIVLGSELEVSRKRVRIFGLSSLIDCNKWNELFCWCIERPFDFLYLDTPTFIIQENTFALDGVALPLVERVSFCNPALDKLLDLGDTFFWKYPCITSVNFSDLGSVTNIGCSFLSNCTSLTDINLSGLTSVTNIGAQFLECTAVTAIDLSRMMNLVSIGSGFLWNCTSLTSLNLSGLCNIKIIGDGFLWCCSSIETASLSDLTGLTAVGSSFMESCNSVTSIDLSGLGSVTDLKCDFLQNCSKLKSIQLPKTNQSLFMERSASCRNYGQ